MSTELNPISFITEDSKRYGLDKIYKSHNTARMTNSRLWYAGRSAMRTFTNHGAGTPTVEDDQNDVSRKEAVIYDSSFVAGAVLITGAGIMLGL